MALLKSLIITLLNNNVAKSISNLLSVKNLAFKYIGGEDIESFLEIVKELVSNNYKVTASLLGEGLSKKEKVVSYLQELKSLVQKIKVFENISVSVKLSSLGALISEEFLYQNLKELLDLAIKENIRVHIDMEDSSLVDLTIGIFEKFREEQYNNLDITFQAYLYRTIKDLEDKIFSHSWQSKPLIRLCKGAYKEPFDKVFPSKKKIDENYYILATKMLDNVDKIYPAFATHDHKLIDKIKSYAQYKGISKDSFEFQMLLGVRKELQKRILNEGYNTRIYVPTGKSWYEYFVRRIAERPSNLIFLLYALVKR